MHEVVLSMALPLIPSIRDKTLSLEQLTNLLQVNGDEEPPFPDFSPTESLITQLNASFHRYAHSFVGVKSVNALNCRKSALLSQMLLRHKIIAFTGLNLSKEQSGPLFRDLIVEYSKIFMSTATLCFDLAPYLGYLPECNSEEPSTLVELFVAEAAQIANDGPPEE